MEMDPYYLAPLGADATSFAALQARALIDAGKVTERQMAEVAARTRRDGKARSGTGPSSDVPLASTMATRLPSLKCAAAIAASQFDPSCCSPSRAGRW